MTRWRDGRAGASERMRIEDLSAENARLEAELHRLRLQQAGVHPSNALREALADADRAGDTADTAASMYAASLAVRSELSHLLAMLRATVVDFERRLERLDDLAPATGHVPTVERAGTHGPAPTSVPEADGLASTPTPPVAPPPPAPLRPAPPHPVRATADPGPSVPAHAAAPVAPAPPSHGAADRVIDLRDHEAAAIRRERARREALLLLGSTPADSNGTDRGDRT